jgi:hypothetical protein
MSKTERIRERVTMLPDEQTLRDRRAAGWRLAAIEWERDAPGEGAGQLDPPFGLRVADDCFHLEDDPGEREVLTIALEQIVQDRRLTQVAEELNRRGFRTRGGSSWSPAAVFELLPSIIEAGPRIFSTEEWDQRRRQALRAINGE